MRPARKESKMKTLNEWLANLKAIADKNTIYGLEMENGLECRFSDYKPMEIFEQENFPWLNYSVVYVHYQMKDNVTYCLIRYKGE